MDFWIISTISQKGGTGKSTLIRAIGKASYDNELNVKVADLDFMQGTTTKWHMRRLEAGLKPIGSVECFQSVADALESTEGSPPDLLLIDGPARASEATLKTAQVSHLSLQPTTPCVDDMEPAIAVFRGLTQKGVDKRKLAFIITGVSTEAEVRDARAYLTETGFHVMESYLEHRTAYRNTHNQGRTILETPYPSLNNRSDRVVQEIFDYLEKHYG